MSREGVWAAAFAIGLTACAPAPELRVVPDPLAPEPPHDSAFRQVPADAAIVFQSRLDYGKEVAVETFANEAGDLQWSAGQAQWRYLRGVRRTQALASPVFPEARREWSSIQSWVFDGESWLPSAKVQDEHSAYLGITDPSREQILALLRQARLPYYSLGLTALPDHLVLRSEPKFARDGHGKVAELNLPVEFSVDTEVGSGPAIEIVTLVLRARISVDPERGLWRVDGYFEPVERQLRLRTEVGYTTVSERQQAMQAWVNGR